MLFLSRHEVLILIGLPLILFLGMLGLFAAGSSAKLRRLAGDPAAVKGDLGPVRAAIYGLLGLLIAFTFAGSAGRFDRRREMAVQESVAIDNAWARVAALPPESQPAIREGLRRYLETRLKAYRLLPDLDAAMVELRRTQEISDQVWQDAVAACATERGQPVRLLVLSSLEAALDWFHVRTATAMHHPPLVIWGMLFLLSLAGALIAGYGVTGRSRSNWTYMVAFAASTAIAVYVILDMEFPRAGMVRVDASDQLLANVLERMK